MEFLKINRTLLGIITVIVSAAAIFMIVVPLLDQPAAADQSTAPSMVVPRPASLDDLFQDFTDRMALDRRLRVLEQQTQTLSNTAPTIVPQQPPIADPPQEFADQILDQRLQRLERQIETLLNMQVQILLNTRGRAAQTRTETFPKSWVSPKQTTTNYRHRRRHEIDGTALAGEPVDANPAAGRAKANASGCPASVRCVERGTAPFTAPTATREYDEAGNEVKGITSEQDRAAGPTAPAPPTDVGRVITRQGANIRDVPTGSAVLRTVPRGTSLHVFARRDGWVQVGEEVPTGWVYSTLVKEAP